jgi:phospholipase/carboxylesterase
MMEKVIKLLAVACVLLLTVSCVFIQKQNICTDRIEVEKVKVCEKKCDKMGERGEIDPYAIGAGDFLDVDLKQLEKQAREAYDAGKFEEAAVLYLKLLRRNVTDGGSIYNLACCYGLLGKAELAAKYLERANKAGFTDVGWMKNDPDFEKVKENEQFKATIASLEEKAKQKEQGKGEPIYISASAEFRCRVMFPEGYDPKRTYPLLVGLHGYGPETFTVLWERFDNPQFIYAVPQAPYPYLRGNEQGYSWSAPLPDEDPASEQSKLQSEEYVANLVKHLKKEYKVGDTYLLGFSQGCGMAYTTGIKNHELFKGLICFGGWLSEDWLVKKAGIDLKKMNDLRIFIGHGSKDTMVKPEEGLKAKEILEKNGYKVTFYGFDGAHTVPKEALLEAQKWMSQ